MAYECWNDNGGFVVGILEWMNGNGSVVGILDKDECNRQREVCEQRYEWENGR